MFDLRTHNCNAWDRRVENGNRWTLPVTAVEIAAARRGEWQIGLTATKPGMHTFDQRWRSLAFGMKEANDNIFT